MIALAIIGGIGWVVAFVFWRGARMAFEELACADLTIEQLEDEITELLPLAETGRKRLAADRRYKGKGK